MESDKNDSQPVPRESKSMDAAMVTLFQSAMDVLQDCIEMLTREGYIIAGVESKIARLKDRLSDELSSRVYWRM